MQIGISKCLGSVSAALLAGLCVSSSLSLPAAGAAPLGWTHEAACQSLTMAAAGGAMPANKDVFVLRYMGSSNYELTYRGSVILFDAQYAREAPARPLMVKPEDLKRVTALYIGHGHSDHMSEAPQIAEQANAPMYGAWPTTKAATLMGLPDKQNITVKNGDVQNYPGFKIEAILGHHSVRTDEIARGGSAGWNMVRQATGLTLSAEELAKRRAARGGRPNGSNDPGIDAEGTIAWLITFDNGYKAVMLDSAGPVTNEERAMMQRIGRTDLASVAYQGFFVAARQIEATLPLVEEFKPGVFLPNHHDETAGQYPDMAMYPLFMAIREKFPNTRSISPLYGTPVCVNTKTKEVFVGETWAWDKKKKQSS